MDERRRTPRLEEENEITITIVSGGGNSTKKKSSITTAKISRFPVLEFMPIFFCPSKPSL